VEEIKKMIKKRGWRQRDRISRFQEQKPIFGGKELPTAAIAPQIKETRLPGPRLQLVVGGKGIVVADISRLW
jgi:hypothetical protein